MAMKMLTPEYRFHPVPLISLASKQLARACIDFIES